MSDTPNNSLQIIKDLESQLRSLYQKQPFFSPQARKLRTRLRDLYKRNLISECDLNIKNNLHEFLWKNVFYAVINNFRMLNRNISLQSDDTAKRNFAILNAAFKKFLEEASGFYVDLLHQISRKYGLQKPPLLISYFPDVNVLNQNSKVSENVIVVCQQLFIYLGDLVPSFKARYQELYGESRTKVWYSATQFYKQAIKLYPSNGNPYNQLAVLAMYTDDILGAVYYYYRSLSAATPFPRALENLVVLFEKSEQLSTSLSEGDNLEKFKNARGEAPLFLLDLIEVHRMILFGIQFDEQKFFELSEQYSKLIWKNTFPVDHLHRINLMIICLWTILPLFAERQSKTKEDLTLETLSSNVFRLFSSFIIKTIQNVIKAANSSKQKYDPNSSKRESQKGNNDPASALKKLRLPNSFYTLIPSLRSSLWWILYMFGSPSYNLEIELKKEFSFDPDSLLFELHSCFTNLFDSVSVEKYKYDDSEIQRKQFLFPPRNLRMAEDMEMVGFLPVCNSSLEGTYGTLCDTSSQTHFRSLKKSTSIGDHAFQRIKSILDVLSALRQIILPSQVKKLSINNDEAKLNSELLISNIETSFSEDKIEDNDDEEVILFTGSRTPSKLIKSSDRIVQKGASSQFVLSTESNPSSPNVTSWEKRNISSTQHSSPRGISPLHEFDIWKPLNSPDHRSHSPQEENRWGQTETDTASRCNDVLPPPTTSEASEINIPSKSKVPPGFEKSVPSTASPHVFKETRLMNETGNSNSLHLTASLMDGRARRNLSEALQVSTLGMTSPYNDFVLNPERFQQVDAQKLIGLTPSFAINSPLHNGGIESSPLEAVGSKGMPWSPFSTFFEESSRSAVSSTRPTSQLISSRGQDVSWLKIVSPQPPTISSPPSGLRGYPDGFPATSTGMVSGSSSLFFEDSIGGKKQAATEVKHSPTVSKAG